MHPIDVPEWGGVALTQELSGTDRSAVVHSDSPSVMFALRTLVDASGHRLFSDADFPLLAAKSAAAISRIKEAGFQRNGLDPGAVERLVEWFKSPDGREELGYYAISKKLHMTVSRFLADAPSLEISKWWAVAQIEAEEMEKARDSAGGSSNPRQIRTMGSYDD